MKTKTDIILQEVCNYFELTPKELFQKTRKRDIVKPRHIFFYLMQKYTGLTLGKIGETARYYQRPMQDHATILHAKQKIENDLWTEKYKRKKTPESHVPDSQSILIAVETISKRIDKQLGGPIKIVPEIVKKYYDYLLNVPLLQYIEVSPKGEYTFEKVLVS